LTELLIKGGTVYTPDGPRHADVHVSDGAIVRVEPGLAIGPDGKEIDVHGMYVLPGAVDVHVHSRDPGFPEKEDFATMTAAAAAGGVTVVLDMPNTVPAVDSAGVLESKAALAHSKAQVDFGLWGLIRSSTTPEQLEAMADAGAVGFKAYLAYSFSLSRKQVLYSPDDEDPDLEPPADYGTLARLAPVVAALGLPLAIHAEDPTVLAAFRRPLLTYDDLLESRPPEAEAVAVSAAATVARESGAHLHIAHLSSALGLQAAEDAVKVGTSLSIETCPQFLLLTAQDFDHVGSAMKMLPPIQTGRRSSAASRGASSAWSAPTTRRIRTKRNHGGSRTPRRAAPACRPSTSAACSWPKTLATCGLRPGGSARLRPTCSASRGARAQSRRVSMRTS